MKSPAVVKGATFSSRQPCSRLVHGLAERGINNLDVLNAIESVPRHRFVDEVLSSRAYEDIPLPIGHRQTISQPFIVALMSEKLIAGSTNRETVLELGTGCGYQTAILAQLYEFVCSIERIQPLFERAENTLKTLGVNNVELRHGDGYDGWDDRPNFDSILLTAAPEYIPQTILEQLSPGGCLVSPVGKGANQRLTVICNRHGCFYREDAEAVRFVPLVRGIAEWEY